jgi:hypothetical protein
MPSSYTKFLIDALTGLDVDQRLSDILAVSLLAAALVGSVWTNIRDWRRKRK